MGGALIGFLLSVVSIFLILIVLVQRGRGGGLAGALGGAGGQSAFGAKAGDVFTRITMIAAGIWIVLCAIAVKFMGSGTTNILNVRGGATPSKATGPLFPGEDGKSSDAKSPAEKPSDAEPAAASTPAESTPTESTPAESGDSKSTETESK